MNHDKTPWASESEELVVLAQGFCDGTLSDVEAQRLEQLLLGKPRRQRMFLAHVDLHARLCWEAGHGVPPSLPMPNVATALPAPHIAWTMPAMFGLLLLVAVAGVCWQFGALRSPVLTDAVDHVAVINSAGLASEQAEALMPGRRLSAGMLELPHGIVELGYANGARLLVESPAQLELIDGSRAFLHSGRLVARVPQAAIGFVVESTRARIVDLGTEFGVSVAPEGATVVQVYEGAVDAELKDAAGEPKAADRLTSGEALALDAAAQPSEFSPHRFVRSFPVEPKSEAMRLSNRSHVETLRVASAAAAPTIDGDLVDWDRAAVVTSRCDAPNGDRYYIEARSMSDAARFYFAAHVGDPVPMASTVDAAQDPTFYWTGGSVVLRLATNNAFGWPLQAVRPREMERGTAPGDMSEQIVHVGMWYSNRTHEPQLMLAFGMDCHRQALCHQGWEGAFRKDDDGAGYTMEYAIDLRLLNVERPPRPGDVWPANLNVHWSDRDGRTCMGVLSEITNQSSTAYNPFQGPTWGKLTFED